MDYDYYNKLWLSITSKRQVKRKKVKFSSVRVGRQFWASATARVAAGTKTVQRKSPVPSGYTNARDGNIFFYMDIDKHVWVD